MKDALNQTIGLYYFDGDGRRVKKVTATETVIFIFDAAGKLVAEYSTSLSQTPQVQYLTNDHLGTPRINTNENGAVVSRTDYMPYGEEIIGLGGRLTTDKYVSALVDRRSEKLAYQAQLPILRRLESKFKSPSFFKKKLNNVTRRAG